MILGHIRHVETGFGWLPRPLLTVLSHLQSRDFTTMPLGAYDLQGKDIYVQVVEATTKAFAEGRPEVHRKYIDVHLLCQGRERIYTVSDNGHNIVDEDSLADRDLLFYRDVEHESTIDLYPGNFAIFLPDDIHRPLCRIDGPERVRKVVVKVATALL